MIFRRPPASDSSFNGPFCNAHEIPQPCEVYALSVWSATRTKLRLIQQPQPVSQLAQTACGDPTIMPHNGDLSVERLPLEMTCRRLLRTNPRSQFWRVQISVRSSST